MFDKMYLRGPSEVTEARLNTFKHPLVKIPDKYYRKAWRLDLSHSQSLIIKTSPRFTNVASPLSIELTPTKWNRMSEIEKILKQITDPDELIIKRLDHAVDIPVALEDIHQGLKVKHKGEYDDFYDGGRVRKSRKRSSLTGVNFGVKPEFLCVYDKAFYMEKERIGKPKRLPGTEVGVCTRFEIRQFTKAIPFQRLSELPNYIETNLFRNIEFYSFPDEMKTSRGEEFKQAAKHKGFHVAYSEFNDGGNFQRTIARQLEKKQLGTELHEIYKETTRSFLDEPTKVVKNSMEAYE